MILIDAQISPHLALWINQEFLIECFSLSYLKLSKATDREIYENAKLKNAIIISKDADFVEPKFSNRIAESNNKLQIMFLQNIIAISKSGLTQLNQVVRFFKSPID